MYQLRAQGREKFPTKYRHASNVAYAIPEPEPAKKKLWKLCFCQYSKSGVQLLERNQSPEASSHQEENGFRNRIKCSEYSVYTL